MVWVRGRPWSVTVRSRNMPLSRLKLGSSRDGASSLEASVSVRSRAYWVKCNAAFGVTKVPAERIG